uniref:G-protein coupled receptors family 3 profile domain-containing protein n=1 Tax=Ciona savignyi TaxID=51511 RepID=H2YC42_CIOSA
MSVETTVDDYILNILTYTGCALSIFGLSLTIVTYTIFKHLRKYKSKRILTHFCFALCGVYIAFLVGIAAHAPSNQSQCIAVSALLFDD